MSSIVLGILCILGVATAQTPQCIDCVDSNSTQSCPNPGACGYGALPCDDCDDARPMPGCPDPHLCANVGCYNCMAGMQMDGCPNPGACGFGAIDCVNCMMGMPMPMCPNATLCASISCFNCTNSKPMMGCPNPGSCGFMPLPCGDCMFGMPMQHCPHPEWCGTPPVTPPGGVMCMDCMAGMPMPMCPDPIACGYCMMGSTFFASTEVCLWFSSWNITTGGEYFGVVVLLITLAFIREWVSEIRVLAGVRRRTRKGATTASDYEPLSDRPSTSSPISSYTAGALWDALYYFVTLTLGYLLMLAVMTYNVGLTVTVIVASAVGRFLTPFVVNRCFKKA